MFGLNKAALKTELNKAAKFLFVRADVRYWDDAKVNGVEDSEGKLIPCRVGDTWSPVIRLDDGQVMEWPTGTSADIHYKVCDAGQYLLANENKEEIAIRNGYYVPDDLLSIGSNGYGDYIILNIDADGKIKDWKKIELDPNDWRHPDAPEPEDD